MVMSSYKIPINMLRQYCFCPRVVFYHMVSDVNVIYPPWVKDGLIFHKRQKLLNKRRSLSRYHLRDTYKAEFLHDVKLEHDDIQFLGQCDGLIKTPEEIIPVEFKSKASKAKSGQVIQLIAYGILAEKIYNLPFIKGFLLHEDSGKIIPVNSNRKIRNKVFDICDKISKILDTQSLPFSPASGEQCIQCEFLNYCNDRF